MDNSRKALIVAIAALTIRLFIGWTWIEAADTSNYRRVAEILAQGQQLYRDTPNIYPYPPPWAIVEFGALWLSQRIPVPFVTWVKILPILADMGIAYILYCFGKAIGLSPVRLFVLYAFNPAAIMVTAMHGQFDSLPIFFLLLACYAFDILHCHDWSAAFLMLAIAIKSFPVLLLPFFLIKLPSLRKRAIFIAIALGPIFFLLLPFYVLDGASLVRELFGYRGVACHGWWAVAGGIHLLFFSRLPPVSRDLVFNLGMAMFVVLYLALLMIHYQCHRQERQLSTFSLTAMIFLSFHAVYPGISSQYLLWAVPFVAFAATRNLMLYTVASTAALAAYYSFQWPQIIFNVQAYVAPQKILGGIYVLCILAWWCLCVWLLRQYIMRWRQPCSDGNRF